MADFYLRGTFVTFTSNYHVKRGFCCENICLHCPYGYTLQKSGLTFGPYNRELDIPKDWNSSAGEIFVFFLKGVLAGALLVREDKVHKYLLLPNFTEQGLDREILEKYFIMNS